MEPSLLDVQKKQKRTEVTDGDYTAPFLPSLILVRVGLARQLNWGRDMEEV